jgi:protein-S-isoprenylcysteine O-methyltransferase Ste14
LVNLKSKFEPVFKALIAAAIFAFTQTTPVIGFMGPMIAPLLIYLPLTAGNQYFFENILLIFSIEGARFFGGIIFYFGLTVFCISLVQWFWYRHKKMRLYNKGLYSKVRHPQFLGIIIMTLGLTIKELTISSMWDLIWVPFAPNSFGVPELVGLWFLQVLGYVAFAVIEEHRLSKKFSEYAEYKNKVPLLLPLKNPKIIPEALFTVMLIVGVCVLLFLLPYEVIRAFSNQHLLFAA